jgi:hypothetical protein
MTRTNPLRQIAAIVAVALALAATAGPASARTFNFNSNGSLVQQPALSTSVAAPPASATSGIDWGSVAIGSTALAFALIAVGAVAIGHRRSRRDTGNHLA